jgi:hypothetical protein
MSVASVGDIMQRLVLSVFLVLALVTWPGGAAGGDDPLPPPPQQAGPVEAVQSLTDDVDALLAQDMVRKGTHKWLRGPLDDATLGLYRADMGQTMDSMRRFAFRVSSLRQRHVLRPKDALAFLARTESVLDLVTALDLPAAPSSGCDDPLPVLHVDADAAPGGDGSEDAPLLTIHAALDAAAEAGLAGVEVRLALGVYREHVEITRDTRIMGEFALLLLPRLVGSISNRGPHCLHVESLVITDAPDGPAGGLYVGHPLARTSLQGVVVSGARGFGVYQHGGSLTVSGCIVERTDPLASPVGVAMYLSGGVQAHLQHVLLTRNDGGGLVVRGPGTDVLAEQLRIERTTINSYSTDPSAHSEATQLEQLGARLPPELDPSFGLPAGRASLLVRDEARFTGRVVSVLDGEYAGVFLSSGAQADLRYVSVRHTRSAVLLSPGAGMNAWARDGGHLVLTYFTLEAADLCGALIGAGGELDLAHGVVAHSPLGACIQEPGYDLARITDDVLYQDNETNFESSTLPVPAPSDPIDLR